MKIQFHVKFYVSLMDMLASKHNTIRKYLYESVIMVFQEPCSIKDPFYDRCYFSLSDAMHQSGI